jgi:hypothetical protein
MQACYCRGTQRRGSVREFRNVYTSLVSALSLLVVLMPQQSSVGLVSFGVISIRSLMNKVDDVLDVLRGRSIFQVLRLNETWHDYSTCVRRRSSGHQVFDCPH